MYSSPLVSTDGTAGHRPIPIHMREQKAEKPASQVNCIRIFIVDDHPFTRHGIRYVFSSESGTEIVGESGDGIEAAATIPKLWPDIVITDIGLPGMNGLDLARIIRKEIPSAEVLIFTTQLAEALVRQAFKVGAKAYVLKTDTDQDLLTAVRSLEQHKAFLSHSVERFSAAMYIQSAQLGTTKSEPEASVFALLTARERQVMQLLVEGCANKEVASRLNLGIRTVETHRAHIMKKLQLNSFSELIRIALRSGAVKS